MADSDAPEAWQHVSFTTAANQFPIRLASVKRPAALAECNSGILNLLSKVKPPDQAGAHVWGARICYWSPEQLEQLQKFEVPPTLVYKFGGMPGPVDAKQWNILLRLLQEQQHQKQQEQCPPVQQSPQLQVQQQEGVTTAGATAAAAGAVAAQSTWQFRNVLLLHVAGRYNDCSIKLLMVPHLNPEATTCKASERVMLWAYFMVLSPGAQKDVDNVEQRIMMAEQPHMAPLTLDDVKRALENEQRRSHEKQWQSCVDYQLSNTPKANGLPGWMTNVSFRGHLSLVWPRGQLDLIDRCFMAKRYDDRATAAAAAADASSSEACDACACGYAAAGAANFQLAPLRCGPANRFEEPCGCLPGTWCSNAPRRRQLLQLWDRDQLPLLELRRCGGGKGFGLFADEDIPAGTAVGEYCGEVLPQPEMDLREQLYQRHGLYYIWQEQGLKCVPPSVVLATIHQEQRRGVSNKRKPDKDDNPLSTAKRLAIDATWMGGVTRFMNHSCTPNCRAVSVCNSKGTLGLDGSPLMLVIMETVKDVKKGEELTFDYSPMDGQVQEEIDEQQQPGGQGSVKQQQQQPGGKGREQKQPGGKTRSSGAKQLKTGDGQGVVKLKGRVNCECGAGDKCRGVIFWE